VGRASSLYFFEVPKNYHQVILAFEDLSGATHVSLNDKKLVVSYDSDEEDSVVDVQRKQTILSHNMVFPPYRVDVTDFVNDKRNTLAVTSSNTLTPQNRLETGVGGVIGSAYLEIIMKE
jgi:beta-galactosidase/beta-glucuronidase